MYRTIGGTRLAIITIAKLQLMTYMTLTAILNVIFNITVCIKIYLLEIF